MLSREPAVRVQGLSVAYGEKPALTEVDFTADEGSFAAIIGPNGSGKTSLIKVLLGIVEPSAGYVEVFGRPPGTFDPGLVGYVPQVKTLERQFPATALELVVSGARGRWPARTSRSQRDEAVEALDRVGAAHLWRSQLSVLSGGELQRVYLARSLIRSPKLVMLDEPAAGIDVVGASDLYELLEAYQERHRATILMVTHDWNVAYHHASHVLILNRRQIGFGPSPDVLNEKTLRQAFGHVGHAHAMLQGGLPHPRPEARP